MVDLNVPRARGLRESSYTICPLGVPYAEL
jgi:hypothetical protein